MAVEKVIIRLTPYNALSIYSFLREYINEDNKHDLIFKAMHDAIAEYEAELGTISQEQMEDALAENETKRLIGHCPDNYQNDGK